MGRDGYNGGGCFGVENHRLTCLRFPSSPGRSLGASGWHSGGGDKNGYLIIIICGITQKLLAMGKQINLATLLNQARSKVLNWMWKGSHEKAVETVQGTFELCVRSKKQCPWCATDCPVTQCLTFLGQNCYFFKCKTEIKKMLLKWAFISQGYLSVLLAFKIQNDFIQVQYMFRDLWCRDKSAFCIKYIWLVSCLQSIQGQVEMVDIATMSW